MSWHAIRELLKNTARACPAATNSAAKPPIGARRASPQKQASNDPASVFRELLVQTALPHGGGPLTV